VRAARVWFSGSCSVPRTGKRPLTLSRNSRPDWPARPSGGDGLGRPGEVRGVGQKAKQSDAWTARGNCRLGALSEERAVLPIAAELGTLFGAVVRDIQYLERELEAPARVRHVIAHAQVPTEAVEVDHPIVRRRGTVRRHEARYGGAVPGGATSGEDALVDVDAGRSGVTSSFRCFFPM
jgi:hypothetical protein